MLRHVRLSDHRRRLQDWSRRPVGMMAMVCLLAVMVLAGVPRTFSHSHVHGDRPHPAFDLFDDHDGHPFLHASDAGPDQGATAAGAVLHVHEVCMSASAMLQLPTMTLASHGPLVPSGWFEQPAPALSRPTPPLRPPIS